MPAELNLRWLGLVDYQASWRAMQDYTNARTEHSPDEIWLLQHQPVFTQGQAGKAEHLLLPGDIPVVQSDRGGQITYHGPGQLVVYLLLDVRRLKMGVRDLVNLIEHSLLDYLAQHQISAYAKADAPGVYVEQAKIASLGLRIRKGCSFHGLALNVAMDLTPFQRINPCGYQGQKMTQLSDLLAQPPDVLSVGLDLAATITKRLGFAPSQINNLIQS